MEPVSWLLVISVIFGGWQYSEAKEAKNEAKQLTVENRALGVSLDESIKIGAENADMANEISTNLAQCVDQLSDTIRQQAEFERIAADRETVAENLADDLRRTDWGRTVIPSDVKF